MSLGENLRFVIRTCPKTVIASKIERRSFTSSRRPFDGLSVTLRRSQGERFSPAHGELVEPCGISPFSPAVVLVATSMNDISGFCHMY